MVFVIHPLLQVPNVLSICGAVVICSCTFLLGVFTRAAKPESQTALSSPGNPAAAERQELETLLGHKPDEATTPLNGHHHEERATV